ncbi:hypothetical protein PENTCL1PPCAC_8637, partial [Pristionchus entomophagus]
ISVLGFCLNLLLLCLINAYSKPHLGNYRNLLKLFACNDILLITLHGIVQPGSFSTGSAIGLFSKVFPDNKYPIYLCCSSFTIPFTLMNINFLHRYWSVKSPHRVAIFSKPCFCAALSLYPLAVASTWMTFCLCVGDDPIGRAVIQPAYLQATGERSMGRGWLLICVRDRDGHWNTETVILTAIESSIHLANVVIACVLCSLTIWELRLAKTFSASYRSMQVKVLRALFAQSLVPILFVLVPYILAVLLRFRPNDSNEGHFDLWCPLASCFPVWDAIVIMALMRDYRQGMISGVKKAILCLFLTIEGPE